VPADATLTANYQQLDNLRSAFSSESTLINNSGTGYISFHMDGYENAMSIDSLTESQIRRVVSSPVSASYNAAGVYRIVDPNGFYVDGGILRDDYRSGVGQLPIPTVYGMTWGELAGMINGEGWLRAGKDACDLTVIPCRNYTHQTKTALIRNPSPNIKDMRAVYLYASTCYFENTKVSVGRGTEFPFEAYGSPYFEGVKGFEFTFTPRSMSGALEPPFMDEACYGEDLREVPIENIWEAGIDPDYLIRAYNAYTATPREESFWGTPNKQGRYWIDLLSGSDQLRTMIEAGETAEAIKASWQDDIAAFKAQRKPYLLYDE
jgi:hypothetical protein